VVLKSGKASTLAIVNSVKKELPRIMTGLPKSLQVQQLFDQSLFVRARGRPAAKALLGKAAIPDRSPSTTGGIGLLGTAPSLDALQECDTSIMAGTSFPYMEFLPKPGKAKSIQIDIDPARMGCGIRLRWVSPAIAAASCAHSSPWPTAFPIASERRFLVQVQTSG
jgi:hypothetical protein